MEKQEFFLLMPAIVYGVAMVDLLKVFKRGRKTYWEVLAWGSVFMVYIIIIWLELWAKLDIVATDKWFFILIILKAILVAQIAAIITPEEKDINTKEYFLSNRVQFFLMISALVIFNIVLQEFFYDDHRPWVIRSAILALSLACVFINKSWIRIATLVVTFALLISILFSL
jgi:hypothetical protein